MFRHVPLDVPMEELTTTNETFGRQYLSEDGEKYPSITTVLSILNREAIAAWRKRVGKEKADGITRKAGSRGTTIHDTAEKYLNNKSDWHKGLMPTHLHNFLKVKKHLDESVDDVIAQEIPLRSRKLKMAGRVDLVAKWDGKLSIIDFKTSLRPKKREWINSYLMQGSFYACAFYEMYGIPIRNVVIVIAVDHDDSQIFTTNPTKHIKELVEVRKKFSEEFNI